LAKSNNRPIWASGRAPIRTFGCPFRGLSEKLTECRDEQLPYIELLIETHMELNFRNFAAIKLIVNEEESYLQIRDGRMLVPVRITLLGDDMDSEVTRSGTNNIESQSLHFYWYATHDPSKDPDQRDETKVPSMMNKVEVGPKLQSSNCTNLQRPSQRAAWRVCNSQFSKVINAEETPSHAKDPKRSLCHQPCARSRSENKDERVLHLAQVVMNNDFIAIRIEDLTTGHWAGMRDDDVALVSNLLSHVCEVVAVNIGGVVILIKEC